jgi:hypothetical protein
MRERLIKAQGRLFLLEAHRLGEKLWNAKVSGWELPPGPPDAGGLADAGEDDDQENSWPGSWTATGDTPTQALRDLEIMIRRFVE